jgi:hypothetical protein
LEFANTGHRFLYWENGNKKIVSRSETYEFTLVTATNITAVSIPKDGEPEEPLAAFVQFVSKSDQVKAAQMYTADEEIELPAGPEKIGERFVRWDHTVEEIKNKILEGETNIVVRPVYESLEMKVKLTVRYIDAEHEDEVKDIDFENSITLSAPEIEGKVFTGWRNEEGLLLSTQREYMIRITKDQVINAVYAEEGTEAEQEPVIAMTGVYAYTGADNIGRITYVMTRSVPENYEITSNGMIGSTESMYGREENRDLFVLNGVNVSSITAGNTANNGIFSVTKKRTDPAEKFYIRGFMIVKNKDTGEEKAYYTDTIYKYSFNDLNNE